MVTIPHSPGIYRITCTANGKVYIGSTTDLRKRIYWHRGDLNAGRHHNRHLQNAWKKYGAAAFVFDVLETVADVEQLHEREQHWLDHYRAYEPERGYNLGPVARAPWLGRTHTEETRQKLSNNARQRDNIGHARQFADKWHGSDAGRVWHSENSKQAWERRQPVRRACEQCGEAYETRKSGKSRFCSNNCKSAARRAARKDHEDRICAHCGKVFSANKYMPTRCCSLSCARYLTTSSEV